MGTEVATQEIPRVVEDHSDATPEHHDVLYQQALARLAVIEKQWQAALVSFVSAEIRRERVESAPQAAATPVDGDDPDDASPATASSVAQRSSSKRWRRLAA